MNLRDLDTATDATALSLLDTSYATSLVYALDRRDLGVTLTLVPVSPPIEKTYPLARELDDLAPCDWAQVAVDDGRVLGVAGLRMASWNRRAELRHLYVDASARQQGVGRTLVSAAIEAARRLGARALWVETQTSNADAVAFYRRLGFDWCGFDTTLYDPSAVAAHEVALFFSKDL